MGEITSNITAAVIGLLITLPAIGATPAPYQCKTRHDLVGPCWSVHGRLELYQGNPMARIWPVGTHRLLGVADEQFGNATHFAAPQEFRNLLLNPSNINDRIYADFEVCPLTKSKPGVMQLVCISGAKHIRVDRFSDSGADSPHTLVEVPEIGALR